MTATDLDEVRKLLTLATGDEKHDASAYSTLDVLWVLYDRVMRYDAANPGWAERDRFILSKGHGPLALYAILAHKGFFPPETLSSFAKVGGILGTHPDRLLVPGIELSTGSLGHGLSVAVGVAQALRAKKSSRRVFVLIGDGESSEGSIWEAILLAGNLGLSNLTCIVLNNYSSSRQLGQFDAKFAAFGWDALTVNGRNHAEIYDALRHTATSRPTAVIAQIRKEEN
jgi:transketolase